MTWRDELTSCSCNQDDLISLNMSESPTSKDRHPGLATDLLHADDELHGPEVSPSISVTTSLLFHFTPTMIRLVITYPGLQLSGRLNLRSSLNKTT